MPLDHKHQERCLMAIVIKQINQNYHCFVHNNHNFLHNYYLQLHIQDMKGPEPQPYKREKKAPEYCLHPTLLHPIQKTHFYQDEHYTPFYKNLRGLLLNHYSPAHYKGSGLSFPCKHNFTFCRIVHLVLPFCRKQHGLLYKDEQQDTTAGISKLLSF